MIRHKRIAALILCALMLTALLPTAALAEDAPQAIPEAQSEPSANNHSFETAESVASGARVDRALAGGVNDYYAVTLPSSSTLELAFSASNYSALATVYSIDGQDLMSAEPAVGSVPENAAWELTAGTYYIEVSGSDGTSYTLDVTVTASGESFPESWGGSNYNSFDASAEILVNTQYTGHMAESDWKDFYIVALPSSGRLCVQIDGTLWDAAVTLYGADRREIKSLPLSFGRTELAADLVCGDYYIKIEQEEFSSGGVYTMTAAFQSAGESFPESLFINDNSTARANTVRYGNTYTGQIAENDTIDWYCITLAEPGRLTFTLSSQISKMFLRLYNSNDPNNGQLWYMQKGVSSVDLTAGTYYFYLGRWFAVDDVSGTGTYTVRLEFEDAFESFPETNLGINNTRGTASAIELNRMYQGQLASNDLDDYFKVSIPKTGSYTVYYNTKTLTYNTILTLETSGGSALALKDGSGSSVSTVAPGQSLELTASIGSVGTYYLHVDTVESASGTYSIGIADAAGIHEAHSPVTDAAVAVSCTADGLTEGSHCSVCGEILTPQHIIPATGHTAVTDPAVAPANGHLGKSEGSHCSVCGEILKAQEPVCPDTAVMLSAAELGRAALWADGRYLGADFGSEDGISCIELGSKSVRTLVSYTYNMEGGDAHLRYPVGMKLWLLSHDGTKYSVMRDDALDNLLRYRGSSIRIRGSRGIRMISGISRDTKNALSSGGIGGYTLEEYGTLLAWADEVSEDALTLGGSSVRSAYAYKRGVADPIFEVSGNELRFTNVVTEFTDAQCAPDLIMRAYAVLTGPDGGRSIVYGGVVQRSIGYIAYQNRAAFNEHSEAYDYIWDMIHAAYGDIYD